MKKKLPNLYRIIHRSACMTRVLAGFFPIGISLVLGLSGCLSDDSYLARRGSSVNIPAVGSPGSPSSRSMLTQLPNSLGSVVNVDAPASTTIGVQDKRYFVSIGRVVLRNHAGDDLFSHPDIYVQVQRRDPIVLEAIRHAEEKVSVLKGQKRATEDELEPLRAKKKTSEIVPGEPLSPAHLRRLAELTGTTGGRCEELLASRVCGNCARYDERQVCRQCEACDELRFLLKKKVESERVPGPALDKLEADRLKELEKWIKELANELRETHGTVRRLRESITGKTHTVTTPGFVLDYGTRPILEISAGDELWISVYDEDVGADDLYGSTVYRVPKTPLTELAKQEVELVMPNVRLMVLKLKSR